MKHEKQMKPYIMVLLAQRNHILVSILDSRTGIIRVDSAPKNSMEQANPIFIVEMKHALTKLTNRSVFQMISDYKFPIVDPSCIAPKAVMNNTVNHPILHYLTHYVKHGVLIFPVSSQKHIKLLEQRFAKYILLIREVLYMQKVSYCKQSLLLSTLLQQHGSANPSSGVFEYAIRILDEELISRQAIAYWVHG